MHQNLRRGLGLAALVALVGTQSAVHEAYDLIGPKWPTATVDYYVNATNLDVDASEAVAAVMAGASTWSTQTNASFSFSYAGQSDATIHVYNAKNEVLFRNASSGTAIATAYTWSIGDDIVDSDIVFWDGGYQFFTGTSGCDSGFYIEDIAAHEFGHAAGVGHSNVSGATMYPSVTYCAQYPRSLEADDKAAIEFLYPPTGTPAGPTAPTSLTANPSGGSPTSSIDLGWVDMSDDETGFIIERSTDNSNFSQVGVAAVNAASYVDSSLASGTTYWYRVMATNGEGDSGPSNVASAQTDVEAPGQPGSPSPADGLTGVDRNADLSWAASLGADSYDVYFGTTLPNSPTKTVTSPSLRLRKLSTGTTYVWKVVAKSAGGTTESPTWSFTTAGGGGDDGGGGGGGGNGRGNGKKK